MKLNLGCNKKRIKGFKGVDLGDYPTVDIKCDIARLTPVRDNSCDAVYASHCLEHFGYKEVGNLKKQSHISSNGWLTESYRGKLVSPGHRWKEPCAR